MVRINVNFILIILSPSYLFLFVFFNGFGASDGMRHGVPFLSCSLLNSTDPT